MHGITIISNKRENNVTTIIVDYKGNKFKYVTTIDITHNHNPYEHLLKHEFKGLVEWGNNIIKK
jgi:hypothetical protein